MAGLILALLICSPVGALLQALAYHTAWGWFCAPQWHVEPTYSTWYGIALIAGMIMMYALIDVQRDTRGGTLAQRYVVSTVASWALMYAALGLSFVTGHIVGWL